MSDFRKVAPVRRDPVPDFESYKQYKPFLRDDFHERCGYCGDHDFSRETYYEIDHFVPKKQLVKISPTEYSNLVYSCRSCNNSKGAKWPTGDEFIHNDGKQGFIDPCDENYAVQFERLDDGSIHAISELGEWMWRALSFGNPVHRVKWKLEEIRILLEELNNNDDTDSPEELKAIRELCRLYLRLEDQLRGKPKFD